MSARTLLDYARLPPAISAYERSHLLRTNRLALTFFWLHSPAIALVALFCGTDPFRALVYTAFVLTGPTLAYRFLDRPRAISVVMGITAMSMGALLVHFGQGPMQIEMHFYFFVLLALEVVFANPAVILISALTVALHHLVLFALLPASVFNYQATIWTVVVHAVFVFFEAIAASFIARRFFDDVIGLDGIIRARTRELDQRAAELRLVLDSVSQGLLGVDRDGVLVGARSMAVDRLLGTGRLGVTLAELIEPHDERTAQWLRLAIGEVFEDVLPRELTLSQLPAHFTMGDRSFSFEWRPIERDGQLLQLLAVISDVTEARARDRAELAAREAMAVLERAARDPDALADFAAEAEVLLDVLRDRDRSFVERLRTVHTLKGSAALFGAHQLAAVSHAAESAAIDEHEFSHASVTEVSRAFADFKTRTATLLAQHDDGVVRVERGELIATVEEILRGRPAAIIAERMLHWSREPLRVRLERVAEAVVPLAHRLGKAEPTVIVDAEACAIPKRRYAPLFQALVHGVRNALDHGIEDPDARRDAGKLERGRIELRGRVVGNHLELTISDDGAGIDWDRVNSKAISRGLPNETEADLVDALFADGVSTRESVTEISGRGIGLSALRQTAVELGGDVDVRSTRGKGTQIIVRVPSPTSDLEQQLRAARVSWMSMPRPGAHRAPSIPPASVGIGGERA